MTNILKKNGRLNYELIFWAGLLFLMLARSFYFGFDYFNYLDDNNTYGVFNRRNSDIWNNIVMWYGLYTFRPIAFLCDAYITQWFWPHMEWVLLFFTLMNFFTLYMFQRIMTKSGIRFGPVGLIICGLTPLCLEATYWIGASTRFVPGMFFSIAGCYILVNLLDGRYQKKLPALLSYFLLNIVSTGFYEQIIVFNLVFTLAVIALNYRKLGFGKVFIVATPFIATALMGLWYIIFWNHGKVASRGQMASGGLVGHFISTFKGSAGLVLPKNLDMVARGVGAFPNIQVNGIQAVILLCVVVTSVYFAFCVFKNYLGCQEKLSPFETLVKLIGGVLLALAPFAPFFILKNNYMSFRAVYPSIFGIALFFDGLADMLSAHKIARSAVAVLTGLVCMAFFAANVAEINNYQLIEADDDRIAENFLREFEKTGMDDKTPIIVMGIQYLYTEGVSRGGYENIASSDWAFLGKVNAVSDRYYFTNILPVPNEGVIPVEKLSEALIFGMDEHMDVVRLYYQEGDGILYGADGIVFGWLEDDGGSMRLKTAGSES